MARQCWPDQRGVVGKIRDSAKGGGIDFGVVQRMLQRLNVVTQNMVRKALGRGVFGDRISQSIGPPINYCNTFTSRRDVANGGLERLMGGHPLDEEAVLTGGETGKSVLQ